MKKIVDIFLIALGVGLMGWVLITGRTVGVAVALISVYLGARGWRKEPKPTFMLIAGCLAAVVAVLADVRFGIGPTLANVLGLIILASILAAYLIPSTRHKLLKL